MIVLGQISQIFYIGIKWFILCEWELNFWVIALLYQNIQYWNKMIHLMWMRVPKYVRQFKKNILILNISCTYIEQNNMQQDINLVSINLILFATKVMQFILILNILYLYFHQQESNSPAIKKHDKNITWV